MATETRDSLRELAAQAWARQQAEIAARKVREIERARENLLADARHDLMRAFMDGVSDPSGLDLETMQTAEMFVGSTDDLLASRPDCCTVVISFLGERFEWKRTGGARNAFGLIHIFDCPECDVYGESPVIFSLGDLGGWLAQVQARCNHDGEAAS